MARRAKAAATVDVVTTITLGDEYIFDKETYTIGNVRKWLEAVEAAGFSDDATLLHGCWLGVATKQVS